MLGGHEPGVRVAGPELEIADDVAHARHARGLIDFEIGELLAPLQDQLEIDLADLVLVADADQAVIVLDGALERDQRVGRDQVGAGQLRLLAQIARVALLVFAVGRRGGLELRLAQVHAENVQVAELWLHVNDRENAEAPLAANVVLIEEFDAKIVLAGHVAELEREAALIGIRRGGFAAIVVEAGIEGDRVLDENRLAVAELAVGLDVDREVGAERDLNGVGVAGGREGEVHRLVLEAAQGRLINAGNMVVDIGRLFLVNGDRARGGGGDQRDHFRRGVVILAADAQAEMERVLERVEADGVAVACFLLDRFIAARFLTAERDFDRIGQNELAQRAAHAGDSACSLSRLKTASRC